MGLEHSEEKVYEVYILFWLSLSVVFIGVRATGYKRLITGLVHVSPSFSDFL